MSSFYTRGGDQGKTGILGQGRLDKDDVRIETLGCIDELSSVLGMARAAGCSEGVREMLVHVQRDLFGLMAELAATPETFERFRYLHEEHVNWIETQITCLETQVEVPSYFILPGENQTAAMLDLARTVTRRAERRAVSLAHAVENDYSLVLKYLNRLSSLCFIMELFEIKQSGLKPSPARRDLQR
ncbi:MAG: cob(I)yrinic acid a,c-diamide adenosyltransferase [Anaerolineae bacterium]|nr:cob(I)yrinic acid a,c-diamide adenosyltransferase [Anaerolineae bacterium]